MKRILALVLLVLTLGSTAQAAPERVSHRQLADARGDVWRCQDARGVTRSRASRSVASLRRAGPAYRAWVYRRWHSRARACEAARKAERTLAETGDWRTAVRTVQRLYPDTESWMLSCSGAEGGHGRWVRYGGGPYYPGYEHTDAVGGQMQFRPSTFRGAYRRGIEYARSRGFVVRQRYWLDAWRSPLGQALAAGYLRYVDGSSQHHWSASVGNGC